MMLEGIRVLDLSQYIAGPQATQVLGDLGADVIKVEPPSGDPARKWGPPFWGENAPLFLAFNRNKRSIVVDMKSPSGREIMDRLIARADVLVQAFRQGVMERLGFGCEAVRQKYPTLIYASLTGYGSEGPYADTPGYDPLLQAYSGIMSITGQADGPPARVGGSVVDIGSGNLIALGVLAALRKRDLEGVGSHVECSLLDTAPRLDRLPHDDLSRQRPGATSDGHGADDGRSVRGISHQGWRADDLWWKRRDLRAPLRSSGNSGGSRRPAICRQSCTRETLRSTPQTARLENRATDDSRTGQVVKGAPRSLLAHPGHRSGRERSASAGKPDL